MRKALGIQRFKNIDSSDVNETASIIVEAGTSTGGWVVVFG